MHRYLTSNFNIDFLSLKKCRDSRKWNWGDELYTNFLKLQCLKELATLRALVKLWKSCVPWPEYSIKSGQKVSLVSASTKTDDRMSFLIQNIWPFPAKRLPLYTQINAQYSIPAYWRLILAISCHEKASWQEMAKYFGPKMTSCHLS